MTEEQRAELERLRLAASPSLTNGKASVKVMTQTLIDGHKAQVPRWHGKTTHADDAAYIVAACKAVPDLLATIARLEAEDEAECKPIWKYTGCGPVLVSTAPDSPKYLASEAVTAFRDVTGVWRCHGSVGGHAELAKEPTHFREAPRRPRLSSRAKDQSQ